MVIALWVVAVVSAILSFVAWWLLAHPPGRDAEREDGPEEAGAGHPSPEDPEAPGDVEPRGT